MLPPAPRFISRSAAASLFALLLACGDAATGPQPTPVRIEGTVLTWNHGRSTNPNTRSFTAGDTIEIEGTAHDRRGVAWIGLEAGDPLIFRDSFAVTTRDTAVGFRYWLTTDNPGLGALPLRLFVRNAGGARVEATPAAGNEVRMYPTLRPPVNRVTLPPGFAGSIYDPR